MAPADPPSVARPGFAGFLGSIQQRLATDVPADEGLRERKKRETRQHISDTATAMFLDRGFDSVRVAEVAEACGVSEKTVYNYFPTKESLLFDREEDMTERIRAALGHHDPYISPIEAAVAVLVEDVTHIYTEWATASTTGEDLGVRRFTDMIERTPSLRAAQRDMMERLVQAAAEAMARQAGVDPEDPEPQIAADAIIGLWRIQWRALRRYSGDSRTPVQIRDLVIGEIRRAARLIDTGLWSFSVAVQGTSTRQQLREAADAANEARKQVVAALRQARDAWRHALTEAQSVHRMHDDYERDARQAQKDRHQLQKDLRQSHMAEREALKAQRQRMQQQAPRDRRRGRPS